ncbi:ATP-binding cassette subfamily C protein [Labedella gwakjiensis]|uniref:ABC transporter ATP-binding protein n=1 Tax=Labedella gwakjiensis TaxID=390269 RepID=A0A2P8GXA9_9MICO|nr:ABC transporter ATP-binding protein [Labedella gwakjiensis]PSL38581.1 ATP-binding cassette subfamily C protein [Labedella gwakjiensis]RUQ86913.1 ABC transporter ATP-binding protein [Labedella gwakjiensis]
MSQASTGRPARPATPGGRPGGPPNGGHAGGHPGGRPGGGRPGHPAPDTPLDPRVVRATPRSAIVVPLVLGLVSAASLSVFFVLVGRFLDLIADGETAGSTDLLLLCALPVVAVVCGIISSQVTARSVGVTERRLRGMVLGHVIDLGVARRSDAAAGRLVSAATTDVEKAAGYRAGFVGPIAATMAGPVLVILVIGIAIDPVSALWLAIAIPVIPLVVGGFQRAFRKVSGSYRRSAGMLSAAFLEAVQGLSTLVLHRAENRTAQDLAARGEDNRRQVMRLLAANQLLILVVDAAFSLGTLALAATLAIVRSLDGTLTFGQAVSVVLLSTLLTGPADVVGQFFYIGATGRAAERGLSAVLAEKPTVPAGRGVAARPGRGGHGALAIELHSVTAGYEPGRPVLRGLSARIEPGEHVALVGPSGVGKSTIVALLGRHLLPESGAVFVGNLDTREASGEAVRSLVTVVDQQTVLFSGTIAQNLRVARADASDAELRDAIDAAGLSADVARMPAGLDTPVGERGLSLSGGQVQRIAIARALLRDAPILVLDEPTSQVDLESEALIVDALRTLSRDRTVLTIAHRSSAIRDVDRVIELGGAS